MIDISFRTAFFTLASEEPGYKVMEEPACGTTEIIHINGHCLPVHQFHTHLHDWGVKHQRMFPWRTADNPFHILVAELMLRRTQARQVIAVYNQFVAGYPDGETLAGALPEEVAQILIPLGLAWRVPAFQQMAEVLVAEHHGQVPADYEALLTLPGVGDYVASAVCSFAFGQAIPVIDTNTVRVAGRLFGIATHAESRRRRPIRQLLSVLLDEHHPQAYNYYLLDLAALVCTPAHPRCASCPLIQECVTGKGRTEGCS